MAYIVNRAGATHSVPDADLEALLARGFQLATSAHIQAWYEAQGLMVPTEIVEGDGTPETTDEGDGTGATKPRRTRGD